MATHTHTVCVGFADCPCLKCRTTRREATERHVTGHWHGDTSYCGACRTADRDAHDSRWAR